MDQILNKVGSYWLGQKANKEINSVGDAINGKLVNCGDGGSCGTCIIEAQQPPNLVAPRGRVHRSISAEGLKELQSFLDDLDI